MEHSLLHGVQLGGLIVALGGSFFALFLLRGTFGKFREHAEAIVNKWARRSAFAAALATFADLFIQVAEIEGRTVYAGVSLGKVLHFATVATVGKLELLRAISVLLCGLALVSRTKMGWLFSGVFGLAGILFAALVSHAAALPQGSQMAVGLEVAHLVLASVWVGGLIHLWRASLEPVMQDDEESAGQLTRVVGRFSPVALAASGMILVSGLVLAARFLDAPRQIVTSPYGLTLAVKLGLTCLVAIAGARNWLQFRPALERGNWTVLPGFRKSLELEATAAALVIVVAGILASISPPGEGGVYQLASDELRSLATPDLPTTSIADPGTFVGSDVRTIDDLRYAEFTHNWSGAFVILLGVCWLAQSTMDRSRFGKIWPLLLIPFAMFIAIAADPEIWILHNISWGQVLADPQLVEHQIGAALVLILAAFGWRDGRRKPDDRPLGRLLPLLIMAGSLMLLGHAHSNLTTDERLSTLINVEHAIIGALGLFAGLSRWVQIRGLVTHPILNIVWPSWIILLGMFMAFFYREVL